MFPIVGAVHSNPGTSFHNFTIELLRGYGGDTEKNTAAVWRHVGAYESPWFRGS